MMNKRFKIILLLFALIITYPIFTSTVSASAQDNLTKYSFDIKFDETKKILQGTEIIKYTNNYDTPLQEIVLHLYPNSYSKPETMPAIGTLKKELTEEEKGNISIDKVSSSDNGLSFTQSSQLLRIKPSTPLAKGATIDLSINFTLKIPMGTGRLGYVNDVYSITNWYPLVSIYDQSANTWDTNSFYPVGESNYSDVSDYTLTIHVPKDIVIASTGITKEEKTNGDLKTVVISADKVRDFVFMMSKYFKYVSTSVSGVKINSYYINDSQATRTDKTAEKMLEVVADSEKFYSETFGKYPYSELDIVETYLSGGAMEYPELIQMGRYPSWPEGISTDHSSWLENAAAHETGHQWWYVGAGDNEFKEPMMDESINTFATAYYFEKRFGKLNSNSVMMDLRRNISDVESLPVNSSVDKFTNWNDYSYVIYRKGPLVFEDLRERIGDEKFIKILRTYYSDYQFKNGSINDFLKVVGEIAGNDMEQYIKAAVNSPDYYPKNIELTAAENRDIQREDLIDDLRSRETQSGITLGSILLRGLEGQKIYIVKPTKLSSSQKKAVQAYVNALKNNLEKSYVTNIVIINDSDMKPDVKKENMILVGNNINNSFIRESQNRFPVYLTSKGVKLGKTTYSTKNITGAFICKNPYNLKNLTVTLFWTRDIKYYDITSDNLDQYIIDTDDYNELRGNF